MISLGVVKDQEKVKQYYLENDLSYNENSQCVSANFSDEVLGYCLFDLTDKTITVRFITPENDIPLADGILRSTLHVAAERSIMDARFADKLTEEFVRKLNFLKDSEEKKLDIDKLFKSCCSCSSK